MFAQGMPLRSAFAMLVFAGEPLPLFVQGLGVRGVIGLVLRAERIAVGQRFRQCGAQAGQGLLAVGQAGLRLFALRICLLQRMLPRLNLRGMLLRGVPRRFIGKCRIVQKGLEGLAREFCRLPVLALQGKQGFFFRFQFGHDCALLRQCLLCALLRGEAVMDRLTQGGGMGICVRGGQEAVACGAVGSDVLMQGGKRLLRLLPFAGTQDARGLFAFAVDGVQSANAFTERRALRGAGRESGGDIAVCDLPLRHALFEPLRLFALPLAQGLQVLRGVRQIAFGLDARAMRLLPAVSLLFLGVFRLLQGGAISVGQRLAGGVGMLARAAQRARFAVF